MEKWRRLGWFMLGVFLVSQLLFVSHSYTHPVTGLDTTCQICLLSSHAAPPLETTSVAAPALPAEAPPANLAEADFVRIRPFSGSPRSPPSLLFHTS